MASTENAGVPVERNYFRDVPHPLWSASGYVDSGPGRAVQRHNVYVGSGAPETNGTVVEPRTYHPYGLDPAADVPAPAPTPARPPGRRPWPGGRSPGALVVAGAGTGRV